MSRTTTVTRRIRRVVLVPAPISEGRQVVRRWRLARIEAAPRIATPN